MEEGRSAVQQIPRTQRQLSQTSMGSLRKSSPQAGDFGKSPMVHGRIVLSRHPSSGTIQSGQLPSSPGPPIPSGDTPTGILDSRETASPPDSPKQGVAEHTPMLMGRSHPQWNRKAYYEAGVKYARQTGETDEDATAFDHLLDQPIEEHEHLTTVDDAVFYQIVWLDSFLNDQTGVKGGGSLSIIFTIWTTMCGSTMLSLPWAFGQAGFMMSLVVFAGGFCVSLYTVNMIFLQAKILKEKDYFSVLRRMSPVVEIIATWTSTLVLVVALMSYHIYATQSVVGCFAKDSSSFINKFNIALLIAGIEWVGSFVKNLEPLFKASTFAIVFVLFNMAFIIIKSIVAFGSDTCPDSSSSGGGAPSDSSDGSNIDNFAIYTSTWPQLASVLCLSFFLHNLICPILGSSKNPEKHGRDMFLGYLGTALCYLAPGLMSIAGFRHCSIEQNFLEMFPYDDKFALVARISVVCQICMVYPLLVFLCRSQIFTFYKNLPNNNLTSGAVSMIIILLAGIPAAFGIGVGDIASIGGGVCGLIWIYLLPISVHFWMKHKQGDRNTIIDICIKVAILGYGFTSVGLLFKQAFSSL
eukprot:TRINITY_DN6873_c0_g1_i1.p1 TRINITY_DN6873_c0_g1~~TRINITY_DN6873_c0_g1_i1.p1  ORF type:complete len:606 (+),score=62.64 TRINITY_DN6873_c0_g1_i1:79-1818(+)